MRGASASREKRGRGGRGMSHNVAVSSHATSDIVAKVERVS